MNGRLAFAKTLFYASIVVPPSLLALQGVLVFLRTPIMAVGTIAECLFLLLSGVFVAISFCYLKHRANSGAGAIQLLPRLLSRIFSGNFEDSIYGIIAFFMASAALFGWFADGVREGDIVVSLGALTYSLGVILSLIFLSQSINEMRLRQFVPKYFISAVSTYDFYRGDKKNETKFMEFLARLEKELIALNAFFDNADVNAIKDALDENEIPGILEGNKPKKRANILPLLAVVYKHRESIEKVDLHYMRDTFDSWGIDGSEKSSKIKDRLKGLYFSALKKAIRKLVPNANVEIELINAPSYDVIGIRKEILSKCERELRERSHEMLFNLTPGTALMSVAYTLVAIKGQAHGAYLKQGQEKGLYNAVKEINLRAIDFADIARELEEHATASLTSTE